MEDEIEKIFAIDIPTCVNQSSLPQIKFDGEELSVSLQADNGKMICFIWPEAVEAFYVSQEAKMYKYDRQGESIIFRCTPSKLINELDFYNIGFSGDPVHFVIYGDRIVDVVAYSDPEIKVT